MKSFINQIHEIFKYLLQLNKERYLIIENRKFSQNILNTVIKQKVNIIIKMLSKLKKSSNVTNLISTEKCFRKVADCRIFLRKNHNEVKFPKKIIQLFSNWFELLDLIRLNKNEILLPGLFTKKSLFEFLTKLINYYYSNLIIYWLITKPKFEQWAIKFMQISNKKVPKDLIEIVWPFIIKCWNNTKKKGFISIMGILINEHKAVMVSGKKQNRNPELIYIKEFNTACESSALTIILDILKKINLKNNSKDIDYPAELGYKSEKILNILKKLVPSLSFLKKRKRKQLLLKIERNKKRLYKSKHINFKFFKERAILIIIIDKKLYEKAINEFPIDDIHEEQIIQAIIQGYTLLEIVVSHLLYIILMQNHFSSNYQEIKTYIQ